MSGARRIGSPRLRGHDRSDAGLAAGASRTAGHLAVEAGANPGGSVAEIDGNIVTDRKGYVPAEAIVGCFVIGPDGCATGEYVRNPGYGPVRDDFTPLEQPGHWVGWLPDTPARSVRGQAARPSGLPSRRFGTGLVQDHRRAGVLDCRGPVAADPQRLVVQHLFPRLSGRRSLSADLPVRAATAGLTRCEPGCPRRKRSAVYRSVCSAGRGEWCYHVIAGMPGACWRALFEPGVRLTRRRDCGPRAP